MDIQRFHQLHEQLVKAGKEGDAARLVRQYETYHADLRDAFAAQKVVGQNEKPALPLSYYDTTDNRSKLESLLRSYRERTNT